jgi:hypothetical protein
MKNLRNGFNLITPYQVLVLGYAIVTLVGATLLSLPFSSAQGRYQPFVDSLFVATSGDLEVSEPTLRLHSPRKAKLVQKS